MQVARFSPAPVTPTRTASGWFPELKGAHEVIKALTEKLVNFSDNAAQLGAIKMALHHVDDILDQQITLHLHDGCRVWPDEEHDKIIARFFF